MIKFIIGRAERVKDWRDVRGWVIEEILENSKTAREDAQNSRFTANSKEDNRIMVSIVEKDVMHPGYSKKYKNVKGIKYFYFDDLNPDQIREYAISMLEKYLPSMRIVFEE